LSYVAIQV